MPFYLPVTTVSIFPHVFSRLDAKPKTVYRDQYKQMKQVVTAGSMVTVGTIDGTQLVKDVLSSKLRAYGYKSFFAVAAGPVVQIISIPFYIFTYGSALRVYAKGIAEIGGRIIKSEMGLINWAWIGLDLALFGEPVSIDANTTLMILSNEKFGAVGEVIENACNN